MTRGTLVSAQGVKEVSIPASNAKSGASYMFSEIAEDKDVSHWPVIISIISTPFLSIHQAVSLL